MSIFHSFIEFIKRQFNSEYKSNDNKSEFIPTSNNPKCKPENVIGGYLTSLCVVLFVFFLLYLFYYFNKGKKKDNINHEILEENLIE